MLEKSPDANLITSEEFQKIMQWAENDEMKPLMVRANRDYLYWDKFKYQKMPGSVDPRLAWFYLKFGRNTQAKTIPAKDKNGKAFSFWLPESVQEKIHFIDCFAGGQISVNDPITNPETREQYLVRSLMEEAISSSILEGAATTREKGRDMLMSGRKPVNHDDQMILNNYLTMQKLDTLKDESFSVDLLFKIHESITQDTLETPDASGRFRRTEDGNIRVVDNVTNSVLFVPPPPEEIKDRIDELIKFINEKESSGEFMHPVVKAVILHFWLGYIHPFVDGNGRTARALFYWYLLKKNYWLFQFISVSQVISKAPAKYRDAYLYSEVDDGDLTYFISYNLNAIRQAIEDLKEYLDRKQIEIETLSEKLLNRPDLNFRQVALLRHALRHSGFTYSIEYHKNSQGVTYQTARTDLLGLTAKGFLDQMKKGKAFYFILNEEIENNLSG